MARFIYVVLLCLVFDAAQSAAQCRKGTITSRLKMLRTAFEKVREFYEDRDEEETALASTEHLHGPESCSVIDELITHYTKCVIPAANEEEGADLLSLDTLQVALENVKGLLANCQEEFGCKPPFSMRDYKKQYRQLNKEKNAGMIKAMGELGMLFNGIEERVIGM
ncbi:interleukin-10 [Anguillid herpesvirus 1]|uniref:Viral interleukin-10 homolog n=1 Tax=Anguillid herpesvirus 1 TaxID=150286 RepID=A0A1J0REE9_9VIRU|nr:interleukin-10 [Anguillid herpesvirus 1]QRM17082.1 interleukin-10 [Anguillid herpesvirus 1]UTN00279.1 interleukin-10 [Anguillid herpesvirus 1]